MKKQLSIIVVTACVMLMFMVMNAFALDGNPETLTIKGDGVSNELTFTRAELEAMTTATSQNTYSVTNNFPTDKVLYRKGIPLVYLLEKAGIKDTARQLKFTSSDGYARTFTCQELLNDARYYFATDGSKLKVPAIIALYDSSKGFKFMSDTEMVLTMGQRVKAEQNNPWLVKYLQTIEVSTTTPDQWPQVIFNQSPGKNGVTVELKHSNYDAVKIYYTTDGTNPTINSNVYNVSASYYQPQLNKPIVVTKNTEIRAIAIGAGKSDSQIASITVDVIAPAFKDLDDYPWARAAIEDLSGKSIISGTGDSQFAPGNPLTRSQFAKMIVLAMGESPGTAVKTPFSDIKAADWYYGYVEKAAELGLINGYPDGTFRPDQVLSRQEMLTILVQAMGEKAAAGSVSADLLAPFANETRISDWARGYVAYAEHLGLLEHGHMIVEVNGGLAIDANGQTVRAEAAMAVYRMLQQLTKI